MIKTNILKNKIKTPEQQQKNPKQTNKHPDTKEYKLYDIIHIKF